MTCPFCRAEFDKLFVPVIDMDMQNELQMSDAVKFEIAKAEMQEAGDWVGNKKTFKFAYGNTHSEVKDPK